VLQEQGGLQSLSARDETDFTLTSEFKFRYLVDPASSDMLVSKIKPCTCQYKLLYGETANGSLNQL
jgi:hypothetical protein